MMRLVFLAVCLLTAPLRADTVITDAFGLFRAGGDTVRAQWSGMQAELGGSGAARMIPPGPAETVLLVFGEKSLVAAGGTGLAAALLLDASGNLVQDGTPVRLGAGDGSGLRHTRYGLATRPVRPGEATGRFHAFAETGAATTLRQSARVSYRVISPLRGLAASLEAPPRPVPQEEILRLEAFPVAEAAGAMPEDGVAGAILLDNAGGSHSYVPAIWIGGLLHAPLLTRDISGPAMARLHLPFVESAPVPIEIARPAPAADPPLKATPVPGIGATRLAVGPFTTSRGYHLHDGSPVTVRITDAEGRDFVNAGWLLDGMVAITVPSRSLPFDVEVTSPLGAARLTVREAQP